MQIRRFYVGSNSELKMNHLVLRAIVSWWCVLQVAWLRLHVYPNYGEAVFPATTSSLKSLINNNVYDFEVA